MWCQLASYLSYENWYGSQITLRVVERCHDDPEADLRVVVSSRDDPNARITQSLMDIAC